MRNGQLTHVDTLDDHCFGRSSYSIGRVTHAPLSFSMVSRYQDLPQGLGSVNTPSTKKDRSEEVEVSLASR